MHDDLEQTGESAAAPGERPTFARMALLDSAAALALAERTVGARLHAGDDAGKLLAAAQRDAETVGRAALACDVSALVTVRTAMRGVAEARIPLVAHALAGHGSEDLAALLDLGWGVLIASGPEDSFDLALVARRAAEDASIPFVVVHPLARSEGPCGRSIAMVGLPQDRVAQSFFGTSPRDRSRPDVSRERALADRVPFALGSALRDYGSVSGRRHDVFDRAPLGEAPLVLVGMGPLGDALVVATSELRARGFDVSAINLTAIRPFPGARLVKALARALAVTVLEPEGEPLAPSGLLSRELKAAFTDALTWAPGYPGIGRVPKLFTGVTGTSFDLADLAAVCENMLADERGKRSFSFTETEASLVRPLREGPEVKGTIAMRWVVDDRETANTAIELVSDAFANLLGLRVHGIVTESAGGVLVDVLATREGRGGLARRTPRIVLATARGAASAEAVFGLGDRSILAVFGDSALPDTVRAIVRERRARAIALPATNDSMTTAVALAGAALAAAGRATLDAHAAARAIAEFGATRGGSGTGISERAHRSFDATIEALAATEREAGRPIGVA